MNMETPPTRNGGTVRGTASGWLRASLLAGFLGLAALVGFTAGGQLRDASAHSGQHPYTHYASGDKWYQLLSDSGSYVTWMTLSYDRHYACTGCSTKWASPIGPAITDWNNTNTTLWYSYYASHSDALDSHVYILSNAGFIWAGLDEVYDENYNQCGGYAAHDCPANQSRPNTWWYEYAYANDYWFPNPPDVAEQRAVIVHELGHGLSFDHPNGIGSDGVCSGVSSSIMDYDCIYAGAYQPYQASDVCGANHKFYDPASGYAGCQ